MKKLGDGIPNSLWKVLAKALHPRPKKRYFNATTIAPTSRITFPRLSGAHWPARTPAVALISRFPTPELPLSHFEPLGVVTVVTPEGRTIAVTVQFRQLQEDPGTVSWVHPAAEPFIRDAYARMALPRGMP